MSNDRLFAAQETAKALIEVEAVLVNTQKPFITTAGWASPVYIDMRKIISFPRLRRRLIDFATRMIERDIGYESLDVVAGGETAGIPFAAWISDSLMLPMQYVRKKPKGFGRNARIEGQLIENGRALLVEDLATDGGSKKDFVQALRDSGQRCDDVFVFFFYDIFAGARDDLAKLGINMHYLATWRDVLTVARAHRYFPDDALNEVEAFIADPIAWSAAHGGADRAKS
ncbi:orotate phosphoribosyltransferase [Methylocystis sp. WRRC1]|uniref:orotate phosphoribosyltransferase n=1 Tax=unclassified Methylocystis TaxID=2625913 RepID=UPI0001F86EB7|nr:MULTISPECIES: orotate phosphoribosyltransferase [unclassified Methylocystis]MCC3244005.1 orotate phosphoribosyltransferase [Methylocystis sp. WRRC1]